MKLHALRNTLAALVLPLMCQAQSDNIKRNVDAHLVFDGREMRGEHESMSKQALIQAFEENKVTVGQTSMPVVSFSISYVHMKGGKAFFGPFHIYASDITNGAGTADTMPPHKRMAMLIKSKLQDANPSDKVFIEDICARTASGDLCRLKPSIFALK